MPEYDLLFEQSLSFLSKVKFFINVEKFSITSSFPTTFHVKLDELKFPFGHFFHEYLLFEFYR